MTRVLPVVAAVIMMMNNHFSFQSTETWLAPCCHFLFAPHVSCHILARFQRKTVGSLCFPEMHSYFWCLQPQVALFNKNLKYYTQPMLLYPQKGSLRFTEEYTEVSHVLLTLRKYSPYFLLSTSFLERNGCKDWWAYWCITAHRTCASIRTCTSHRALQMYKDT